MEFAPFDLIVVGAGPGGAMAAWTAARDGKKVLLLDRVDELPRYKPCGGGIPSSVLRHIPELAPSRFVDVAVTRLRHSWKGRATALSELSNSAEIWMVQRPLFDKYLVDEAVQAGATLCLSARARNIKRDARGVTVELADGRAFSARHLIGADGATGIVSAQLGLRPQGQKGIAREIELPFSDEKSDHRHHPALFSGTAYLEYGTVDRGYAWIFPKRGALSVGAGILIGDKTESSTATNRAGAMLKDAIFALLASVGINIAAEQEPRMWAHPIPEWSGQGALHTADGRAMLVGDAAGVVLPLFGEGIQYAMRTGVLAAQCVLTDEVHAYTARVRELFADNFDAAGRASRVFYKLPRIIYHLGIKRPVGARLVSRLLSGETTFAQVEDRLYERLRKVVKNA